MLHWFTWHWCCRELDEDAAQGVMINGHYNGKHEDNDEGQFSSLSWFVPSVWHEV